MTTEKQDAFDFLKSILPNIESILMFETDINEIQIIICYAFAKVYSEKYKHDYIFNDISDEEFVSFIKENIPNIKSAVETKAKYTVWQSLG